MKTCALAARKYESLLAEQEGADAAASAADPNVANVPASVGPSPAPPKQEHIPVIVKSITLQSFTFPEFFFRCSSEYPQVEPESEKKKLPAGMPNRLWDGNGFLDSGTSRT